MDATSQRFCTGNDAGAVDAGEIDASRYLEAACVLWIRNPAQNNAANRAFKLLPAA